MVAKILAGVYVSSRDAVSVVDGNNVQNNIGFCGVFNKGVIGYPVETTATYLKQYFGDSSVPAGGNPNIRSDWHYADYFTTSVSPVMIARALHYDSTSPATSDKTSYFGYNFDVNPAYYHKMVLNGELHLTNDNCTILLSHTTSIVNHAGVGYAFGTIVKYNGKQYICKVPFSTAVWTSTEWTEIKFDFLSSVIAGGKTTIYFRVATPLLQPIVGELYLDIVISGKVSTYLNEPTSPVVVANSFTTITDYSNLFKTYLNSNFKIINQYAQSVNLSATSVIGDGAIKFTYHSTGIPLFTAKGQKYYLQTIDPVKVDSLSELVYGVDDIETNTSVVFKTTFPNYGKNLTSLYNQFDEDFFENGVNLSGITNGGFVFFGKTPGAWANNVQVYLLGANYWNSADNDWSYLFEGLVATEDEVVVYIVDTVSGESEKYYTSVIDGKKDPIDRLNYYIVDVINSQSNLVSCQYVKKSGAPLTKYSALLKDNVVFDYGIAVTGYDMADDIHTDNTSIKCLLKMYVYNTTTSSVVVTNPATPYALVAAAVYTVTPATGVVNAAVSNIEYRYEYSFDDGVTWSTPANITAGTAVSINVPGLTYELSQPTIGFNLLNNTASSVAKQLLANQIVELTIAHYNDVSHMAAVFNLANGNNASALTATDLVNGYKCFTPEDVQAPILAVGSAYYSKDFMASVMQGLTGSILGNKLDCYVITNTPFELSKNSDPSTAMKNWAQAGFGTAFNNDFYEVHDIYFRTASKDNGPDIIVPKAFSIALSTVKLFDLSGRWFPATEKDGILNGVKSVIWIAKEKEEKIRLESSKINYTEFRPGFGYFNNSAQTWQPGTGSRKRRTVVLFENLIKFDINNICRTFVWKENTGLTRSSLGQKVIDYLDTFSTTGKDTKPYYEFYVVCDSSNNIEGSDTINIAVGVWHVNHAKFIQLDFISYKK